MTSNLQKSKEILEEAVGKYQPYAKVLMLSGGDDSLTTYWVCKTLGIKIDYILHGNTRTGIQETTDFVRHLAENEGIPYIEADAGLTYENRVMRKGFYGVGKDAHTFSWHELKKAPFRRAISENIRHKKRNRPILLINGVRIEESDNRAEKLGDETIRADGSNIWVNAVHYWSKTECRSFLADCKVKRNPVSELLCRSGECMCGTTQNQEARREATYWFPAWGKWLDSLEDRAKEFFPWGWSERIPKSWQLEQKGQLIIPGLEWDDEAVTASDWQPMCQSCLKNAPKEEVI